MPLHGGRDDARPGAKVTGSTLTSSTFRRRSRSPSPVKSRPMALNGEASDLDEHSASPPPRSSRPSQASGRESVPESGTCESRCRRCESLSRATMRPSGRPMRFCTSSDSGPLATWRFFTTISLLAGDAVVLDAVVHAQAQLAALHGPRQHALRVGIGAGHAEVAQLAHQVGEEVSPSPESSPRMSSAASPPTMACRVRVDRRPSRVLERLRIGEREMADVLREGGLGGVVEEARVSFLDHDPVEVQHDGLHAARASFLPPRPAPPSSLPLPSSLALPSSPAPSFPRPRAWARTSVGD